MELDAAVATIFEGQLGLITAAQACDAGFSRRQMQYRVQQGVWSCLQPGVYLLRGAPRSWPQIVLSSVLAAGDLAVASHRTAARLWRFPVDRSNRIEITTPLEKRVRLIGVRAHQSGIWTDRDISTVTQIPVTSPSRTLADLSTHLGVDGLGRAVDDGLRRGILSLSAMHSVAQRFDIAPGRSPKAMHAVLERRIPGYDPGDSELETRVWEALCDAGLPAPTRRHAIHADGRRYVIDLAYVEQKIAIEVDGFEFHRPRTPFDGDRARQNIIVLAGWTPLRYTSASTSAQIVAEVTEALSRHEATRRVAE